LRTAPRCTASPSRRGWSRPGGVDERHIRRPHQPVDRLTQQRPDPQRESKSRLQVMTSGGFATTATQVVLCQFALNELLILVDAAHAAGLPVAAHAHGLPAVHMAMTAGVDDIEHCSFLSDTGVSASTEDLAWLADAAPGTPNGRLRRCPGAAAEPGGAAGQARHEIRAGHRDIGSAASRGCCRPSRRGATSASWA
jgi:imidazolonepropionase-like amidohydrolase